MELLLQTIYFEDKSLYKELNLKPLPHRTLSITNQLKQRPFVQRVFDNLKRLTTQTNLNRFEVTCEVPHLNLIGITGYRKKIYKAVYVEILDEYTCVKDINNNNNINESMVAEEEESSIPNGLMALKLRILDGLSEGVIVVCSQILLCLFSRDRETIYYCCQIINF